MRIYCALTRSHLDLLNSQGGIESDVVSKLVSFAQTPRWVAMQEESDPELLAEEILQLSAAAVTQPGYVVVAELADAQVAEVNPDEGQVQISAPIRLKDVSAFFLVDENAELSWFGPTELPVLLDLGS